MNELRGEKRPANVMRMIMRRFCGFVKQEYGAPLVILGNWSGISCFSRSCVNGSVTTEISIEVPRLLEFLSLGNALAATSWEDIS